MNEQRNIWKCLLWACLTWLGHFVALFVIFVTFVICMPGFIFIYDKLDMALPSITINFIKFSDFMVAYWYLLVIPLFFDFAFLIGASLSRPKVRWLARAWSTALLYGTILLLGMDHPRRFFSLPGTCPPRRPPADNAADNAFDPTPLPSSPR